MNEICITFFANTMLPTVGDHKVRQADVFQQPAMQRSDILILFKAFDARVENSKDE